MSDPADTAAGLGGKEVVPPLKTDGSAPAPGAGASGPAQKKPARPEAEIRADLVKERAALGASFDALRADLDEAVDSGRERLSAVGRKARVVAPAVGAVLAVALVLRRRSRRRR